MAENLMETQTGGAGETVQLAPETPVTPEQFDVQLPNVGQQQQTAPPVPADSEPPAAPPVEPPTTPPSPVVQQSMLEAEKQVQDEQAGQAEQQAQGPLVSQLPFSAAKQPIGEGVGYVDWFSGDATKSIEDEESKVIDSLMNEPDLVQPQVITQNEIDEINEQQKRGPVMLDGVMIGGSMPLDEDEDGVMPSFAVDDFEEDERFQNFTLDGVGSSEEMKAAGLDPTEPLPKGLTPTQWAEKKKEVQAQYPGWTVVVGEDGVGVKVVKEEIQQQKPLKDKPLEEKPKKDIPANQQIFNKIMPYPKNPGVDYMTDGTHWYKKRSGTNNPWLTITNDGSVTTLNKHFKTSIPKVTKYSYPNKPYEYAVVKGYWNIRKKGDTEWKTIYQPERIKVLNGSFNKKLGVPVKLTKAEIELNKAAANLKQAGMNMNSPKIGAVSTDGNGGVLMSGINNAMSTVASTMEAGGLFTAPSRPSLIPGSMSSTENVATENISGIEKNRQLQIDYVNNNPNLSPEKKKAQIDLINKESNALIGGEKSRVQGAKEYEKEVTKQVFTAPLPKEVKVKKEIDISDQINKQFGIEIHKDNIPLIDTNLGLVDRFTEQQKQETLQSAQNFADRDLDAWRKTPQGRMLDDEQFKSLKEAQINTKRLIQLGGEDADFSLYGMSTLNSQVEGIADSYKTAVDTNNTINQAAAEGKSMDEFLLDNKKKLIKEIDINNEAIVHAKELFNATAAIHDFVTPYIKSGKVTIDKNGMYRISSKANTQDKKYLEDKLGQLMNNYNELKNGSYNTYQDDIAQLRNKKKIVNGMLITQRKELAKAKKGTPQYDAIVKKINATKKRISDIDGTLDNLNNSSRAFFSTDAKGAMSGVASFMKISGFNAKLLATNSKLTPKQRFDIVYESLQKENEALAMKGGVRADYLYTVGARVRSMLDWNTLGVELSSDEKKFFANQKVLNQLLPYYLNNENGITEESTGFWNSFMNSARAMTYGKDIAGAEGNFTGTDQAITSLQSMIDLGFTKEDLTSPMAQKDIEDRRNVAFWTRENWGAMGAPTLVLIGEILVTKQLGAGALALGKRFANLAKTVDATGDAIGYGDKVAKLYESYATVMGRSRFGRYTFDAVEQAALFEATGQFIGTAAEEMNALSGFAGSFASSAVGDLMGKLPFAKAMPIIKSMFGNKADDAVKTFKKFGELNATGVGETAEEFAQELTNIYQNKLDSEGFFEAVGNRFGSFDEVMKFVVSSYVMGAGFGLVVPKRAQEAYNSMNKENKERVDNAITAVRKDFEDASAAYNNAAEVLTEEIEIDLQLNAEPETEADIDSKQENAGTLLNGEPTPDAEGKIQEGEVTEAEVEQKKEDDTKDEAGLPSEVREGEKPVETKPFPEASQEEAGPSGVVQEEQEVAPTEEGLQFDLPRAGEEIAPKEGELQFELPKGETEVQEGVTESTLTREFDLTEEQVVEEATEQVADIMADEKLSEEQKEEKIDEVVVKTNKRKTAAKMRKGEKQLFPEPSKQLKEEIKAKAEPMVEEKKAEKEVEEKLKLTKGELKSLSQENMEAIYDSLPAETQDKISPYGISGVNAKKPIRFLSELRNAIGEEGAIKLIKETIGKPAPEATKTGGAVTDKNYDVAQEVNDNVAKANPDASVLLTPKGDDLSLTSVYVGKEKRGKGIGTKVLETVKSEADRTGKKVVLDATNQLGTETDLERLSNFYEKNGFTKVGDNKFEYNPQEAKVETKENPFDDLSSVTKLPSRSPKRKQAIADFDAKHGEGAYERVSKIDAKFGEITKKLEDNKVIKKDC
jgi:GNAT superfamily N-acetyltransferase